MPLFPIKTVTQQHRIVSSRTWGMFSVLWHSVCHIVPFLGRVEDSLTVPFSNRAEADRLMALTEWLSRPTLPHVDGINILKSTVPTLAGAYFPMHSPMYLY